MENTKGSANQKKNPAGNQEIPSLPRWSGQAPCPGLASGSQLVTGGFCYNHEFGQLETELAFPVRHWGEERKAQDQQKGKQEQNSPTGPLPGCQALLFLLLHTPGWRRNSSFPLWEFNWDGTHKIQLPVVD